MSCDNEAKKTARCLEGPTKVARAAVPAATARNQAARKTTFAKKPPEPPVRGIAGRRFTVEDVLWRKRKQLSLGAFSVVYEVAPGIVAKVGQIDPEEVERQKWAAERGWALPIYDYHEEVTVSKVVTRETCPVHGYRSQIVIPEQWICTCEDPTAILLMPLAEELEDDDFAPQWPVLAPALRKFQLQVADAIDDQFNRMLDVRPSNVMRYKGKPVIIDFGEEGE